MTTVVGCKHRAFIRYFGVNIGISGVKIILSVCSITFVVLIGIVECILRKGVFEATVFLIPKAICHFYALLNELLQAVSAIAD